MGTADFTGSDHQPQVLHVDDGHTGPRCQPRRNPPAFSWDRFNTQHAARLAEDLQPPGPMLTPDDIDRELARLTRQLTDIAELTAGRREARPPAHGRVHPAWNQAVETAHTEAVAAKRAWLRAPTLTNRHELYKEAHQRFRHELAAQSRAAWRRGVHEASDTPWRLWALERWARLRSHLPPAPLKITTL